MTIRLRGAFCVAAVCLAGCGAASVGTISGKVVFADGSDSAGLPVTLLGAVGQTASTGAGGAYSFDKLPDGVYLISVDAIDTVEHKLSFGTQVKGKDPIAVPDLVFNAVASLGGKVNTAATMPAVGATVYLSGSDRVAVTDATGSYRFSLVPAGDYSLVAKAEGTIAQSATAAVTLKRGKNDAPPLTLANDLGVTGKLEGTVYYFNGDKPSGIKLSVADLSVNTDDAGFFSLSLPPGTYSLIAEAAGYPKQSLGRFTVRAGETTVVQATPISLYKMLPLYEQGYSPTWMAVSEGDIAILKLANIGDYYQAVYAIDTKVLDRKLLFLGSPNNFYLSKMGKWFAFQPTSYGVAVISTVDGKTYTFAGSNILGPVISTDEATMMFWSQGQNLLVRVDLNTGTATTLPAFGGSFFQSNDRFLAKSSNIPPFDVQLITPTSSPTAAPVFSGMQVLQREIPTALSNVTTYPLAWAYNCAAACDVRVLGLAATSASAVLPPPPSVPSTISGSVRDWLALAWGGVTPDRILVKVADGTRSALPVNTFQLLFNEAASRVVTYATSTGTDVREDTVPPSATSPVHLNAPFVQSGTWISPTRFVVFESAPTVTKLEIKNGVATTDLDLVFDLTQQSPYIVAPAVMWLKTTTMKRVGIAYDSAEFPVDTIGPMSANNFSGVGARSTVLNSVLGKYAVIFDGASAWVFDGAKAEARKSPGNNPSFGAGQLFVTTDRFRQTPFGPAFGSQAIALQFFETGKTLLVTEPNKSSIVLASMPKGGTLAAGYTYNGPNLYSIALAYLP